MEEGLISRGGSKTYDTGSYMAEIGIVYAYVGKLGIILHKLPDEPSVGIGTP